jgi:hypothetical protein
MTVIYDKETVANIPEERWQHFRKTAITKMIRIEEPFSVQTSEGLLTCQNGWLAMDARGYPYPIAVEEQAQIYEPVTEWEFE